MRWLTSNVNDNLMILVVDYVSYESQFKQLSKCKNLEYIDVHLDNYTIQSLDPLSKCKNLKVIRISKNYNISSLEPLRGFKKLKVIRLNNSRVINSLEPIKDSSDITDINFFTNISIRLDEIKKYFKKVKQTKLGGRVYNL